MKIKTKQRVCMATFKAFPTEAELRKLRKKRKAKPIPLNSTVLVWWLDAAVTPGWHDGNKLKDVQLSPVLSCGFIVHRNRQRIVLSSSLDRDGDTTHCFAIPRSQITATRVLYTPGQEVQGA